MRYNVTSFLSSVIVSAALIGAAPLERRQNTVSWFGYNGVDFTGDQFSQEGVVEICLPITEAQEITNLRSAITAGTGTQTTTLFTTNDCSDPGQVIDTAGYKDMTTLPAYVAYMGHL